MIPAARYRAARQRPSLARQRMTKVGKYGQVNNNTRTKVTGWTSDTTAPATVVSDSISVQGAGSAIVRASVDTDMTNWGLVEVWLVVNGVTVASASTSAIVVTVPVESTAITLAAGDLVWLEFKSLWRGVLATSWVEVAPAP